MGLLHDKVFSYENGGDCSNATASADKASIKSKTNNPVLKLKQKYLGPVQRGFKMVVCTGRMLTSVFQWRNFGTTFTIMVGLMFAMVVAYFFPYARAFKAAGFAFCGPQNYIFSHLLWRDMLKKQAVEVQAGVEEEGGRIESPKSVSSATKRTRLLGKLRAKQGAPADKKKDTFMVAIPRRNAFDTSRWRDSTNLLDASHFYERSKVEGNGSFRDSLS